MEMCLDRSWRAFQRECDVGETEVEAVVERDHLGLSLRQSAYLLPELVVAFETRFGRGRATCPQASDRPSLGRSTAYVRDRLVQAHPTDPAPWRRELPYVAPAAIRDEHRLLRDVGPVGRTGERSCERHHLWELAVVELLERPREIVAAELGIGAFGPGGEGGVRVVAGNSSVHQLEDALLTSTRSPGHVPSSSQARHLVYLAVRLPHRHHARSPARCQLSSVFDGVSDAGRHLGGRPDQSPGFSAIRTSQLSHRSCMSIEPR
jgi:hypothetical protein